MSTVVWLVTEPGESARTRAVLDHGRQRLAAHGIDAGPSATSGRSSSRQLRVAATGPTDDVVPDDTRVVVSLRPLSARLFVGWADEVEDGCAMSYDDWVRGAVDAAAGWDRGPLLHPELLVRQWATAVGAERVTVLAAPTPRRTLRTVERHLGVPARTLRPVPAARPLTGAEAELVRAVNRRFAEEGWPEQVRVRYVGAASRALRRSRRRLRPVPVPAPTGDEVAATADRTGDNLERLQVRVLGDPRRLSAEPAATKTPAMLPTAAAARAVAAAIGATGAAERSPHLDEAGPRDLLAEIARRVRELCSN